MTKCCLTVSPDVLSFMPNSGGHCLTRYIDDNMANAYLAMLLYLQSEDAKKPVCCPVLKIQWPLFAD